MKTLWEKWKLFIGLIFDPWTLCFLIATTLIIYLSHSQTDPTVTNLFTVLITLSSAVLGGRFTKQWTDITEGGVVVARGKAAVRGLKLLLNNIVSLDKRLQQLLARSQGDKKYASKVITTFFEEIRERCSILADEAVSSIENWTDIIPEADVKTHIGAISALGAELEGKEVELRELQGEFSQAKDIAEDDKRKLRDGIREKEKEIAKLEDELRSSRINFGAPLGITNPAGITQPSSNYLNVLSLTPNSLKIPTGLTLTDLLLKKDE